MNTAAADFVTNVNNAIINPILEVIFVLATVYFMYGIAVFIMGAENQEQRNKGKSHMFWAVIGLLVMISVGAILQIGLRTLGVGNNDLPNDLPFWL